MIQIINIPTDSRYVLKQGDTIPEILFNFEVTDDNQKHFNNSKTFGGYKSYYKTVLCVPTDQSQFISK